MLENKLKELKLQRMAQQLTFFCQEAAQQSWGYDTFLEKLCDEELAYKHSSRCDLGIRMAKFPTLKTLESFDFTYQSSLNEGQVKELSKGRWVAHGENLVFLGPPGVGKTHLAIALGIEAIKQGHRTLFMTTQGLLTTLAKAHSENRLEEKIRALCSPKVLIIDEMGYLPLERHGAHLFFQLVAKRYEKGALIVTSNQSYGQWGDVFGDQVLATAILDRLLHHSTTIHIKGESYRLKEKLKSGLVARTKPQ